MTETPRSIMSMLRAAGTIDGVGTIKDDEGLITVQSVLSAAGYSCLKTSSAPGYITRKNAGIITEYSGRYGNGCTIETPSRDATRNHSISYWIADKKAELDPDEIPLEVDRMIDYVCSVAVELHEILHAARDCKDVTPKQLRVIDAVCDLFDAVEEVRYHAEHDERQDYSV